MNLLVRSASLIFLCDPILKQCPIVLRKSSGLKDIFVIAFLIDIPASFFESHRTRYIIQMAIICAFFPLT